jgi:hypothetical protein
MQSKIRVRSFRLFLLTSDPVDRGDRELFVFTQTPAFDQGFNSSSGIFCIPSESFNSSLILLRAIDQTTL